MLTDKLKKFRKENHLTQEELAEKLYVSRSTVAKWEQGRGIPDRANLSELSKFMGIEEDELLEEDEDDVETAQSRHKMEKLEALDKISLTKTVMNVVKPGTLSEIVGQNDAVKALASKIASPYPQHLILYGPPGVGKTHLASALGLVAAQHRFSTYYINCHQLIEQLKKAHFENRLPDKLKILAKYRMLIIDEIGYLPMDIQGANLFFQLIARRYEKTSTVFTSNKTFSQWNEVFADVTIASAILDRVLHHCTVINIKGESYRLKERKEFMRQKQQIVNTLFDQGNA